MPVSGYMTSAFKGLAPSIPPPGGRVYPEGGGGHFFAPSLSIHSTRNELPRLRKGDTRYFGTMMGHLQWLQYAIS